MKAPLANLYVTLLDAPEDKLSRHVRRSANRSAAALNMYTRVTRKSDLLTAERDDSMEVNCFRTSKNPRK